MINQFNFCSIRLILCDYSLNDDSWFFYELFSTNFISNQNINQLKKLLLLLFMLMGTSFFSRGQSYNFRRYEVENGLSYNSVVSSLQDKKGFLWFGTKDGLNRFDGNNFKIFRNDPDEPGSIGDNFIHCLFEDNLQNLWVGTRRGIFRYNPLTETFTLIPYTKNKEIRAVKVDAKGNIWYIAGTTLYMYNEKTRKLIVYDQREHALVTSIVITEKGEVWLCTTDGYVQRLKPGTRKFENYSLFDHSEPAISQWTEKIYDTGKGYFLIGTSNQGVKVFDSKRLTYKDILTRNADHTWIYARDFVDKGNDEYWIGTESGLFIYNVKTGGSTNLRNQINDPYSLSDNSVYTLTRDKEGGIWAGTYFGGVNYYPKQLTTFTKFFPQGSNNSLSGYAVREICADKNGNLWIGTEDGGLNMFNPQTGLFKNFKPSGTKTSISHSNIHGLMAVDNELWVGTFEQGLDVFDINTYQVIRRYRAGFAPNQLKSNFIESILRTRSGDILVGSSVGLYRYNKATDDFTLLNEVPGNYHYSALFEDKQGTIWAATLRDGLYYFNPGSKTSGGYKNDQNDKRSLASNDINSIYQDSKDNLWIATENGLCLFNKKEQDFVRFSSKDGFPSSVFYGVLEDRNQHLWISTSRGLVCYDPVKKIVRTYTKSNGLLNNQFNYKSSFLDKDGRMYFGSVQGMISFRPGSFRQNEFISPVYITGFQIYNQEIQIGHQGSPLTQSINYTKELSLSHNQSTFSIDFAALGYTAPQMTVYRYMMEGLDKHWTFLKKNRKVYFTNLSPGSYLFRVKAANSGGKWDGQETMIRIVIQPPFWKTNLAYAIYFIIFVIGNYYFIRYYHQWIENKNARRAERWEAKKEKELYQAKIEFFTNVTHEIRTPLTLISGPLDEVIRKTEQQSAITANLATMKRNTERLIELTDQLLDFRKAEVKGFSLNFVDVSISKLLNDNYERYHAAAVARGLTFKVNLPESPLQAYADIEALNKILSNLIDNGLKYSYKQLFISLSATADTFTIHVKSDGALIPLSAHHKIFEPFYRMKDAKEERGTGIGLPLARSLAELHEGTLTVENQDGQWNVFVLTLPMHHEREFTINTHADEDVIQVTPVLPAHGGSDLPTILLVEDNLEIRNFITAQLLPDFVVRQAANGEEALRILDQTSVHLIVSDIMMPVMDGFALCKTVKDNLDYTHIPIILLTASNSLQSKIEGLEVGADAYIEKPFSPAHLLKQISNLLASRDKIKNYFAQSPLVHIKSMAYNKADEAFLEKVADFINKNIDNKLNVDQLADLMNMSRPTFYRKIKTISNLSPLDLIRITRLKKAAELLSEGIYSIQQIAGMTGFGSQAHFGKSFLKQFGISPLDYVNSGKKAAAER